MATRTDGSWKDDFAAEIVRGGWAEAIAVLDSQKTGHAGTPRQAVKLQAAKIMSRHYGEGTAGLYDAATAFAGSESEGAQEVGLVLLGPMFGRNPANVTDIILILADSENWEVREWAASALRRVISENFAAIFPTVREWAKHASPNVRRAAAVASGSAAGSCTEEQCRMLLEALTPLLEDDDPYVRKNMGAFAIGGGFMKAQPALVADWLRQTNDHPRAQWNAAMALSAAEAANCLELLSGLLEQLAADERTAVRRAVYRAVLNLAKRIPEEVLPRIQGWKDDPARCHVYAHVKEKMGASGNP
ncbi:MAG: HEAT repeat domain-containing protein [Caldilineaceae bacterium]|nr:HEAT repeat domain-containing protein [Caldilineaceae bacterium]MDE0337010.1 HEAT repeat domain-containing protein [Caldilineaceae bacterium]